MMAMIGGITELVLVVDDVPVCADFYERVVGLTPDETNGGTPSGVAEGARAWRDDWAWFWTGAVGSSVRLALTTGPLFFQEKSPLPEGERFGRVHFAIEKPREEMAGAIARLREHGVEVLMGEDGKPVRLEWMKAESVYFYDPAGNQAEFWSPDVG